MKRIHNVLTGVVACALVTGAAQAGQAQMILDSRSRPIDTTLRDRIQRDTKGNRWYVTAHDGVARPLIPLLTGPRPTITSNTNAESGAVNIPISSGLTILPINIFPQQKQPNGLPMRVMLNELGLVSPVKDQGCRGSCTLFSAVGAIESQYLASYGKLLNLSEEYVINMMNENRSPDWVGGMPSEKLYVASQYGVAPTSDWAYLQDCSNEIFDSVAQVFGVSTSNASAMSTLGNNVWNNALDRDIANYNSLIYPPAKAHRDAIYGPAPGAVAPVAMNGTDPTPFETLLAQHHAISFATAIGAWQMNSSTGVFEWNAQGDQTIDHAIVLVGYDHSQKVFRIKNSWSAGWNGDGFAEITYDLFFRTVAGPYYVTQLRNPTDSTQGGTGIWRGFWRGNVNGSDGIAVVHHAFGNASGSNVNVVSNDAGYFYANNGSVTPIEWLGGNASSATVTVGNSIVWLSLSSNSESATALEFDWWFWFRYDKPWTRCVQGAAGGNLDPTSYLATSGDPYLFSAMAGCPR